MNLSIMLENMNKTNMLSEEVKVELSNAITGFKAYWINMLKNPMSWSFSDMMGASTSEELQIAMFVDLLRHKDSYSDKAIEDFSNAIDSILLENIKETLDNIESISVSDIIKFSVDYDPYHHLSRAIKGIDELSNGVNVFPCKTLSRIGIGDIILKDGVLISATIKAESAQGYGSSFKKINIDGKLEI